MNPSEQQRVFDEWLGSHPRRSRQAVEMARDVATLTGGVSLVDTNDASGGIDRAVRDASTHHGR